MSAKVLFLSEFFDVSGYFDKKSLEIKGFFNQVSSQVVWNVEIGETAVQFTGHLRALGTTHLIILGKWQSSELKGEFIFTKPRQSKAVDIPLASTTPLRLPDQFKGNNIEISDDGQRARRVAGYSESYCISIAPLAVADDCRSYEVCLNYKENICRRNAHALSYCYEFTSLKSLLSKNLNSLFLFLSFSFFFFLALSLSLFSPLSLTFLACYHHSVDHAHRPWTVSVVGVPFVWCDC